MTTRPTTPGSSRPAPDSSRPAPGGGRPVPSSGGPTAVVIGAGIAGLTAARVLADRFARVVLVDRDRLPETVAPRRGVPQGGHGHVLLVAGQQALGELFPGLVPELVGAGAVPFDPGLDLSLYRYGAIWPRSASGIQLVTFSRPLLESTLLRRVRALPNVVIRDGAAVAGLTGTGLPGAGLPGAGLPGAGRRVTGQRVTGVRLDSDEVIASELVVDCSGRGNRSDRWLAALGSATPRTEEVKVGVGYATRLLRRRPGDLGMDAVAIFVMPSAPHEKRAGLVLPIEGNRWLVSMGGWHGDFPADDEQSFREHARSLPHPAVAAVLDRCEPVSDLATHRFPSSRRRRFEELARVPAGYLALGDAICSFNPIYGQGMTCAALEAVALGRLFDRHGAATAALSRDFYREAARIIATPWQFAAGGDFAYPETRGIRPRGIGLLNSYGRQIQLAAQVDAEVRRTFTEVQHLITAPAALRRPRMVWRVVRSARRAPGARTG